MALAANTATVQLLDDNATHVVAKFQFFQNTANAASHENSVIKINCDTLVCRTMDLTLANVAPGLWPGDIVTQQSNTSIVGKVASWSGNVVTVSLSNSLALFANSEIAVFSRPNSTAANLFSIAITSSGANKTVPKLTLRQAAWSIAGNTNTRVALEWAGNPNTEIIAFGVGSGYIGKNNLATAIPNDANAATGDVNITTYVTPALSGYSIIAEFSKIQGFAPAGY